MKKKLFKDTSPILFFKNIVYSSIYDFGFMCEGGTVL